MRTLPLACVILLAAAVLWSMLAATQGVNSTLAELPREFVDTRYVEPTGQIHQLVAGDDFQQALDRAQPGDVIELQAGATFEGPFILPNKSLDEDMSRSPWIIIRSSDMASLPTTMARVTPQHSAFMPKLVASSGAVITTEPGAHHYRFIGVEIYPDSRPGPELMDIVRSLPSVVRGAARVSREGIFVINLIMLGDKETQIEQLPHHLIFDRCYIHGDALLGARRGIAMNSRQTAVINSHLSDFKEVGADSQAIAGWNGSGPFAIVNNYLEGAGENVMFGGAQASIEQLVPSDIEIRGNHFYKPLSWREQDSSYAGTPWSVKNIFELKNARRVLVEGNLMEHNWPASQNGFAILYTVRNEGGTMPWAVVEDITFRHNIVSKVGSGINILGKDDNGRPSQQSSRIHIHNNLFASVGGPWGAGSFLQLLGGVQQVSITHNTIVNDGRLVFVEGRPIVGFEFLDNIAFHGEYGISGSGTAPGRGTQARYLPDSAIQNNLIVGGEMQLYPDSNRFPLDISQVGFVDPDSEDYRLQTQSRYLVQDSPAPGVDMDALCAALSMTERTSNCVQQDAARQ